MLLIKKEGDFDLKTQQLTCPDCGAHLSIKQPRSFVFCEYCGTQIYIDDEVKRTEHTININKNISIQNKQVIDNKAEVEKHKSDRVTIVCLLLMIIAFNIFGLLLIDSSPIDFLHELFNRHNQSSLQESGISLIVMPSSSSVYVGENYETVVKELKDAGFTNVVTVKDTPDDLLRTLLFKENEVIQVTINDKPVEAGKEYRSDSQIIVSYYYLSSKD